MLGFLNPPEHPLEILKVIADHHHLSAPFAWKEAFFAGK